MRQTRTNAARQLRTFLLSVAVCFQSGLMIVCRVHSDEPSLTRGLVGYWPLAGNEHDSSGNDLTTKATGLKWTPPNTNTDANIARKTVGIFDGRSSSLEVDIHPAWKPGTEDFTLAARVSAGFGGKGDYHDDDNLGDLISLYDPVRRRGFHLGIKTVTGMTFNQASCRQLQFGVDNDRPPEWRDCGIPGKNSLLAFGLVVHNGRLFAGTCEPAVGDSGHVYQYSHGQTWIDCGSPAPCNAITAMATHGGHLYVGIGKYRVAGSSLAESENPHLGGQVFRYDGYHRWTHCGQLPNAEAVSGMVTFQGKLYAGSLYKPGGFFRYEGGTTWKELDLPGGKRVEAFFVHDGSLYASSYDVGNVFRFDGQAWQDLGPLGDPTVNTQTYSFTSYLGRLHAGTWRSGRVYRLDEGLDGHQWFDTGRLGEELEVMGMLVHNGRLVAGTLPLAEVHQYEHDLGWKKLIQLDQTPDVKYRRAWAMAEYQGQLFCSTLPSGRIHAGTVGRLATWDREFPAGTHHVVAMKRGGKLLLFVDGELKSSSSDFAPNDYDLTVPTSLKIGFGPNDFFRGSISQVRLYSRALSFREVTFLAAEN